MLKILSTLVDHLPLGVVVLDAQGRAVVFNEVEARLSGRDRAAVLGHDFFREHGVCMDVPELAGAFRAKIGREPLFVEAELSFPFPFLATPRQVRVQLSSFESDGAHFGLLVLRDVAHERAVELMRSTLGQMIVHDLQSPLTAVVASLGALEDTVRDDTDAREALALALEASGRIEAMLTNLLDTSLLETNAFPLTRGPCDVHAIASRAVALSRASARRSRATISFAAPDVPLVAELDGDVVRRMLENLLDNALRHCSHVDVDVALRAGNVVIEVRDDGPGIPAELRERIFEKYVQVVGGRRMQAHNRGLGLTFVQLAARAHGGDAEVECPPGGGSVFRVTLPASLPALPRPRGAALEPLPPTGRQDRARP